MQLHRFEKVIDFCDRAEPFLQQEEVAHNLLLRICKDFRSANSQLHPSYLSIVEEQGRVIAVALRTPPFPLVLSMVEDVGAIELIARDVQIAEPLLPGVNGPQEESDLFAEVWQRLTAHPHLLQMVLRIHQLTTVQPVAKTNGLLRLAREQDFDLLKDWYIAFEQEAMEEVHDQESAMKWAKRQVTAQILYLWENDGQVVSAACGYPASDRVGVINFVYTPLQYRKRGYATACVAAVSQRLLDHGYAYCALYTDMANPTSNKIYRAIGYQPVCDWHYYKFGQLLS